MRGRRASQFEIHLGVGLIRLVNAARGGDIIARIGRLRSRLYGKYAQLIPRVRIRDDLRLDPNDYTFHLDGYELARDELLPKHLLAIDMGRVVEPVEGWDTIEPAFGWPAVWIEPEQHEEAERAGYLVVPPSRVMMMHLEQVAIHEVFPLVYA